MSVEVLHGAWLPGEKRFFLWGESAEQNRRKGKQAKIPSHPFQSTTIELRENMEHAGLLHNAADQQTQVIWLPATEKAPQPSPELLATGAIDAPEGDLSLRAWHVGGLALSITQAVDLLLALGERRGLGADIKAWHLATLLAMETVAAQEVVPGLLREGFQLRAAWRPRPDPEKSRKIAALAKSLPPLCRAIISEPNFAPAPRGLLDDFIAAAADAAIRDMPFKPLAGTTTTGGKWMAALLDGDPLIPLKGVEADELFKGWQNWSRQEFIAGDENFRVTFRLEPPEKEKQPWTLAYLLQANDDPSLLVPATSVWREKGQTATFLRRRFEQPQEKLLAALGYAAKLFPPIEASLRQPAPSHSELSTAEAFTFLKEAVPLLEQSGFGVLIPPGGPAKGAAASQGPGESQRRPSDQQSKLGLDTLVEFNWEITLGDQPIQRGEFERLVALKMPLVNVRGKWIVLDPEHLRKALSFFDKRKGNMSLVEAVQMIMGEGEEAAPEGIEVAGVEADGWLGELMKIWSETQHIDLIDPPEGFQGQLRQYQVRGFSWLTFLRRVGFGACLADDMGLGKTPQTIALLLHEREQLGASAPALLVCPTSVVGNWSRELQKFAPSIPVRVHHGPSRKQGHEFVEQLQGGEVVLTSYPLLARDRDTLAAVRWGTVVLDEAQNIKNASTKQAQAARALKPTNRIALTGTPVENRLSELWSIMSFLNPGYLGSEQVFRREFARPIERTGDEHARERLRKLTTPFILRRLKTDKTIISDLPEKMEMKVYCSLTREQASLYEAVVQDALRKIESAESDMAKRGLVLMMLTRLKQVCNHPAQFLQDNSALPNRSGKLSRLVEMLEEVYANNDRALIFSQFSSFGGMLKNYLGETFYDDILFLYGDTPIKERDAMVRRFQAPDGPRLFIISLKAGGVGLNLTAANHVFHYDRWWNPAVENQATDRAFRIGQTRNVQVHKFICGGTLEDHIDEMIESKRALAESVIGDGESWITELSTDELRKLVTLRKADIEDE